MQLRRIAVVKYIGGESRRTGKRLTMAKRTGYLTVFSADRSEVYGEFADADWITDKTEGGLNHVMSGTGSDGTLETFTRLNDEGISHVAYAFDADGVRYAGQAQLLAPDPPLVRIETGEQPASM